MTLQELRVDIELIDSEIIRLIRARMDVALKIAEEKEKTGHATHDPARAEAVLSRASSLAEASGLDPSPVRDIFTLLIRMSEDLQDRTRR